MTSPTASASSSTLRSRDGGDVERRSSRSRRRAAAGTVLASTLARATSLHEDVVAGLLAVAEDGQRPPLEQRGTRRSTPRRPRTSDPAAGRTRWRSAWRRPRSRGAPPAHAGSTRPPACSRRRARRAAWVRSPAWGTPRGRRRPRRRCWRTPRACTPPSPAPSSRLTNPTRLMSASKRGPVHRDPHVDLRRVVVEHVEPPVGEQRRAPRASGCRPAPSGRPWARCARGRGRDRRGR